MEEEIKEIKSLEVEQENILRKFLENRDPQLFKKAAEMQKRIEMLLAIVIG